MKLGRVAVGLLVCIVLATPRTALAREMQVGDRGRDIAGWDIVGQRTVSSSEFAGRWLLVNFWASW